MTSKRSGRTPWQGGPPAGAQDVHTDSTTRGARSLEAGLGARIAAAPAELREAFYAAVLAAAHDSLVADLGAEGDHWTRRPHRRRRYGRGAA